MRLAPAYVGDSGEDIALIQRKLGVFPADGYFDENTAARVRGFQHVHDMMVTGDLDEVTFRTICEVLK